MTSIYWTNVPEVRRIADVTEDDYDDAEIADFIASAQKEVNSKVIVKVIREKVGFIDSARQNKIDGSNTTFYIKNWFGNYLADSNYDNAIDISDIKVTAYNSSTMTESDLTVSSINVNNCSFVLTVAPTTNLTLYVTYAYTSLDPLTPDSFLEQCTTYLAGSYLFIGNDDFKVKFGNVNIEPSKDGGKGNQLYNKYLDLSRQLSVNSTGGSVWTEMAEKI